MADFLLEIGLDEIPARMIAGAETELGKRVSDLLTRERLLGAAAKVTTYSTPRRLAVLVEDVLPAQADTEEKLTGPSWKVAFKDGTPTAAAEAFAKKATVPVAALEKVTPTMRKMRRALLSVSDKSGLALLARTLAAAGVELISTGGTAKALREAGLEVADLSAYTGFPEMLDGRVKTLHPKVHGGLLYRRGNPAHEAAIQAHGIEPIDLVVVNLYPFEQTAARPEASLDEAIENIDIGGPSMLRSAAKNHESVTVVVDPADYAAVAEQVQATGNTTLELRRRLAAKVFARTAAYDAAIAAYLEAKFEGKQFEREESTAGETPAVTGGTPILLPARLRGGASPASMLPCRSHSSRRGPN